MQRSDIELNDEMVHVQRRLAPGIVLSLRLSAEESEALHRIANDRALTLTRIARNAIRACLRADGAPAEDTVIDSEIE